MVTGELLKVKVTFGQRGLSMMELEKNPKRGPANLF
jgi:hypothetical protein